VIRLTQNSDKLPSHPTDLRSGSAGKQTISASHVGSKAVRRRSYQDEYNAISAPVFWETLYATAVALPFARFAARKLNPAVEKA